jgi:dienelactone hydrolase
MNTKVKMLLVCLCVAVAATSAPSVKAEPSAAPAAAPVSTTLVGQGFVANFSSAAGSEKKIGILALGGAEGGLPTWSAPLAEAGYPVLSVGYFKVEGRPDALEEIALEYFDKPIAWLESGDRCRSGGIVVAGASKGAELALLLASRKKEIVGVIALAPSSVVWQATPKPSAGVPVARSSWTAGGKPLVFVPFDYRAVSSPFSLLDLHRHSLFNVEAVEAAAIPVEKINGPILLLSGEDDRIWPSSEMGEAVVGRLKANNFRHAYTHVIYPAAGHSLDEKPIAQYDLGGTAEGNRRAHLDSWKKIFEFLSGIDAAR